MAGLGPGPAVPVWLAEDDLGCIICQGLLDCPATLPCGHSFCRRCLESLWDARGAGDRWACPTCREVAAQQPQLRKNTLLQDLADKYRCAAREVEADPDSALRPGPGPSPAPRPRRSRSLPRVEVQKSITEVGQELTELGERLVDIVRSLQSQRPLSESGPDNELSILGKTFSSGVDLSMASPKLVTSDAAAGKIKDILHDLEEIQEKLRENFSWKEAPEAQTQGELLEALSSSSCPLSDQSHPALRRASQFAQWAINPTFNLKSLSCSLEVSRDFHTVTVSPRLQPYRLSCERFSTSQVLCSQALSSGKHYWEVDTRNCSHWAVGVASWEMSRDQVLGRTTDSCCVEWKGTNQLSAWHMVKETVLGSDRPGVVGIWLNLEEGKLAFYSVDNQEKLLYECTISASSPLHPAFWLYGLHPGNHLIIKQVKV
ncbi:E3 ubiquitin-protein ligase RNF135 isoform X1 [Cebus imitator]|uniref:E3 ubiquitin-protein ligase RNF135 n=1 Tax=Cebus imitator TaxID=2715852 RepID=A0A2K5RZZ5_CEBIM|nr:E3 ubiquitin-protein ligase RNF135 isoform X1 [Cebus imitator]